MPHTPTKQHLRRTLRHRRRALPPAHQHQAATSLARHLTTLLAYQTSRHIALYLATDGELDIALTLRTCPPSTPPKRCYVPIIPPLGNRHLRFARLTPTTSLTPNRHGIPEPAPPTSTIPPEALDLVLMPLVAFDPSGNRLGMGGGYYDTTFAFKHTNPNTPPHLIGIAHECQCVPHLTTDHWDIPLTTIITDQHIYPCNTG